MTILGLAILLIGFLLGIHILFVIGLVVLVVGLVALALSYTGHPVGGRRWY
jgi:hypothetical protein